MRHFYAISRRDLPVHQQAIQSAHAQLSFANKAPELVPDEHPPFVWLTVENKMELLQLCSILHAFDITVGVWHDPDYDGYDPSAISCMLQEDERYLLSELPLWKVPSPPEKKRITWINPPLFSWKGKL